jgi:hypothetical protein
VTFTFVLGRLGTLDDDDDGAAGVLLAGDGVTELGDELTGTEVEPDDDPAVTPRGGPEDEPDEQAVAVKASTASTPATRAARDRNIS